MSDETKDMTSRGLLVTVIAVLSSLRNITHTFEEDLDIAEQMVTQAERRYGRFSAE